MAMNPLPPQAFTKDTLQKAYHWLLNQNASIKDLATSQDVLVSLYLKAQRDGHSSLETPTIQNFKQELKSLVNLMGDLQGSQATSAASGTTLMAGPASSAHQSNHQSNQHSTQTASAQNSANSHSSIGATFQSIPPQGSLSSSAQNLGLHLDPQSLSAIAEIRANLNLGSDTEALRALISIGYKHLKKI